MSASRRSKAWNRRPRRGNLGCRCRRLNRRTARTRVWSGRPVRRRISRWSGRGRIWKCDCLPQRLGRGPDGMSAAGKGITLPVRPVQVVCMRSSWSLSSRAEILAKICSPFSVSGFRPVNEKRQGRLETDTSRSTRLGLPDANHPFADAYRSAVPWSICADEDQKSSTMVSDDIETSMRILCDCARFRRTR